MNRTVRTLTLAGLLALTLGGPAVDAASAATCRTSPSVGDSYRTTCDDGSSYRSRADGLGGYRHSGSFSSGGSYFGRSRSLGNGSSRTTWR